MTAATEPPTVHEARTVEDIDEALAAYLRHPISDRGIFISIVDRVLDRRNELARQ